MTVNLIGKSLYAVCKCSHGILYHDIDFFSNGITGGRCDFGECECKGFSE